MQDSYVKLVILLKKKKGMSFDDFKAYYETRHSKLITLLKTRINVVEECLSDLTVNVPAAG